MVIWGRSELEWHHASALVYHVGPMPSASASLARPAPSPWYLVSGAFCLFVYLSLLRFFFSSQNVISPVYESRWVGVTGAFVVSDKLCSPGGRILP